MTYQVIVSHRAKQMLATHLRFLANINATAAKNIKDKVLEALRPLENMPQRCPFFNEKYIPPNKYHKMFVDSRYLSLFQIKDATVYVDYIVDCRQDYQWLIQ